MSNIKQKKMEIETKLREVEMQKLALEKELRQLKENCPHENINKSEPWVEEGRDNEGYRMDWQERVLTCLECGENWREQISLHAEFDEEEE